MHCNFAREVKGLARCIRYIVLILAIAVFLIGRLEIHFNTMLLGIFLFWSGNIIYSFEKIKTRIFFFMFNAMIFVFLISRPIISFVNRRVWWHFSKDSVNFALLGVMISLIFLLFGDILGEYIVNSKYSVRSKEPCLKKKVSKDQERIKTEFIKSLRIISLVFFYISISFFFASEAEKLLFMRLRNYVEIYTSFVTKLPYFFTVISSMHKYLLCIFLATKPKKSVAFIPLTAYVLSAVPSLIIGLRNPIVLNIIFMFLYYYIRDIIDNEHMSYKNRLLNFKTKIKNSYSHIKKWLGPFEWVILSFMLPLSMVFLGMYNYIREGLDSSGRGVLYSIVDFMYKQGVSFDVLCIGYNTIPKIQYTGFTNYTFGGIIDYITHNKLAQVFFGSSSLGTGNNIVMALYSNNFSHRMSYAARGREYLNGHGWGSSYILETYADFGYIGIIVFSVLLGILFAFMINLIKKGSLPFAIVLIMLTSIYFCPRDAALGWLNFILYTQFILPTFACYFLAGLCAKRYSYKNHIVLYSKKVYYRF